MEDQRVVLRTALCLKDPVYRIGVQAVGAKAIDRFRGDGYKATLPQDLRGSGDLIFNGFLLALGIPQVIIDRVHNFASISFTGRARFLRV